MIAEKIRTAEKSVFSVLGNRMNIYLCRKSISDLKNPIIKREYETAAATVREPYSYQNGER